MTEETAKELAAAMRELASALRSISSPNSLSGGVNIYHHGLNPNYGAPYYSHAPHWNDDYRLDKPTGNPI